MSRLIFSTATRRIFLAVSIMLSSVLASAQKGYMPKTIDVNKADTTVWISVPGIGSKLAGRIVSYRDKLHGFISVDQVAEVYGLPDSVFQRMKPFLVISEAGIGKIDINTASIEDLKTPYISYNLANIIYQYRLQHGAYRSLEDLKKIMLIDETLYAKITPYLSVKE